ncbi:Tat proofreading chaperone DmsD [Marinospirillum insulare]|uniref:Tat proofreading chaperone DmsD n=1 Tax=Marinospirillum insulare TaxID=217169 RepID=A0ABQ5ZXM2_9GAMM|nr:Tat proofreading chaperone DmsD [Marinospirillum insulare]GLR62733.1 Tat proofreading chaperone DmsD [Marinospirillum insulare]
MNLSLLNTLQNEAHALGALFYYGPSHEASEGLFQAINEGSISEFLPNLPVNEWQAALAEPDLHSAWQASFYGPDFLDAPPWGSVYLDPERVVFGVSLIELRSFLNDLKLELTTDMNEPEDHFGLLLLLVAQLAAEQQANQSKEVSNPLVQLLTVHLLPWSERYLSCLSNSAEHPFIKCLADYSRLRLVNWQKELNLKPIIKDLYWPIT